MDSREDSGRLLGPGRCPSPTLFPSRLGPWFWVLELQGAAEGSLQGQLSWKVLSFVPQCQVGWVTLSLPGPGLIVLVLVRKICS